MREDGLQGDLGGIQVKGVDGSHKFKLFELRDHLDVRLLAISVFTTNTVERNPLSAI